MDADLIAHEFGGQLVGLRIVHQVGEGILIIEATLAPALLELGFALFRAQFKN